MNEVSIKGADKAAILASLYNESSVRGMGWLQAKEGKMTRDEAAKLLEQQQSFDYLYGRVMKINLKSDTLNLVLYDRDNGAGAGYAAIQHLLPK